MPNYLQVARSGLGQARQSAPSAFGALLGPSAKAITSVTMWSLGSIAAMYAIHSLLVRNRSEYIPRREGFWGGIDIVRKYAPTAFSFFIGRPCVHSFGYGSVSMNSRLLPEGSIIAPLFTNRGAHVVAAACTIGFLYLLAKDWVSPANGGTTYKEKLMVKANLHRNPGEHVDEAVDVSSQHIRESHRCEVTTPFKSFLTSIKEVQLTLPSEKKISVELSWGAKAVGSSTPPAPGAPGVVYQRNCLIVKSESFAEAVAHIPDSRFSNLIDYVDPILRNSRNTQAQISHLLRNVTQVRQGSDLRAAQAQVVKAEEAANLEAVPALAEENLERDTVFCCAVEALRCAFSIQGKAGADLDRVNLGRGFSARVVFKQVSP